MNACRGNVVQECWYDMLYHYSGLELDIPVVTNHVRIIIVLVDERRAGFKPAPTIDCGEEGLLTSGS